METNSIIGLLAAGLTTVALVPQTLRTIKLRQTKDLSWQTYLLLSVGVGLWLVYGIFTDDLPVIVANGVTLPLSTTILLLKLKHG